MQHASVPGQQVRRRPNALVTGQALVAGDMDQSVAVLGSALSSTRDPAVTGLCWLPPYMEKGDAQRAKELLADNIHHQELTPQSVEWRDSLFELGKILYREASLAETQSRLNEAHSNADPPGRKELAALEANFRACREAERMLSEAVEHISRV
jgi:hypothetical protein